MNNEELRTLKDLKFPKQKEAVCYGDCVPYDELKTKAIKWVKEDLEKNFSLDRIIQRWMKRLDITQEDLK